MTDPSGDDYTPARLAPVTMQSGGSAMVSATAPLPLLTNDWAVEASGDLTNWVVLTNVHLAFSISRRSWTAVARPGDFTGCNPASERAALEI